jgi:hypothetical protein
MRKQGSYAVKKRVIKASNAENSSETPNEAKLRGIIWRAIPRRRWADMSPLEKTGNILMAVADIATVALTLLDIRRRPANEIHGSKRMRVMTALIQPFGPVLYFLFGRKRHPHSADTRQLLPA